MTNNTTDIGTVCGRSDLELAKWDGDRQAGERGVWFHVRWTLCMGKVGRVTIMMEDSALGCFLAVV